MACIQGLSADFFESLVILIEIVTKRTLAEGNEHFHPRSLKYAVSVQQPGGVLIKSLQGHFQPK